MSPNWCLFCVQFLLLCILYNVVYLRVKGGEDTKPAVLAPKTSPLGLPPKKVGQDINKATKEYKGLRVTVRVDVLNRQPTVTVVPAASSLVLKELGDAKTRPKDTPHTGSITLDQVYKVAREMRARSLSRTFTGTVMEMLGTVGSSGAKVDGKSAYDVQTEIADGEIAVPEE